MCKLAMLVPLKYSTRGRAILQTLDGKRSPDSLHLKSGALTMEIWHAQQSQGHQ